MSNLLHIITCLIRSKKLEQICCRAQSAKYALQYCMEYVNSLSMFDDASSNVNGVRLCMKGCL
jgi:hypothetical protein